MIIIINMYSYIFICFIYVIKTLIEAGSSFCITILCTSSKNNPFESHYIGNLSNYFYDEINTNIPITNNKYNYALFNNVNTEEHIFNGSKKIYSDMDNKNKLFLRKLVSKSFCSEIRDDFEKYRGTKLSNIFDLYYDKIHKISIGTFYLSYFFVFFYPILLFFKIFNKTKKITPLKNCLILAFPFLYYY